MSYRFPVDNGQHYVANPLGGHVADKIRAGGTIPFLGMCTKERARVALLKLDSSPIESCGKILDRVGKKPAEESLRGLVNPPWLKPYIEILDRAATDVENRQEIRYVVHAPSQHGKTTATVAGFAYCMIKNPGKRSLYVTYNSQRAGDVQELLYNFLRSLGFKCSNLIGKGEVRFNGHIVYFRSIQTQVTGYTCNCMCVMDDLFASYEDALSEPTRKAVYNRVVEDIMQRSNSGPAFICMGTRQNNDDVAQRLLDSPRGFEYLCIPALCMDPEKDPVGRRRIDEPLTEAWSLETGNKPMKDYTFLSLERMSDPVNFELVYQGQTITSGQCVFMNNPPISPVLYSEFFGCNVLKAYGIDLGFSGKGDWSTLVEITRDLDSNLCYITGAWRMQATYERFGDFMSATIQPGCKCRFYARPGAETNIAELLLKKGVDMVVMPTNRPKVVRAKGCYRAWNSGTLLMKELHKRTTMEREFYKQIVNTTFSKSEHSPDDADALAAAYDQALIKGDDMPILGIHDRMRSTVYQIEQSVQV